MRYGGIVGYGVMIETRPGLWEPTIVDRPAYGDVLRPNRQNTTPAPNDVKVTNQFSIVADSFARAHYLDIRYATWMGKKWTVMRATPETDKPRLILELGDIWKEETEEEPEEEEEYDEEDEWNS